MFFVKLFFVKLLYCSFVKLFAIRILRGEPLWGWPKWLCREFLPHSHSPLCQSPRLPLPSPLCNRQKNLEPSSTKQKSQQSMPLLIICINTIYGAQCPNKDIASQIFMHRPFWVRNHWENNYLRFFQLSRNCFQKSFLCDAGVLWGIENTTNFYRKELLAIYIS